MNETFVSPSAVVCPKNLLQRAKGARPARIAVARASAALPMQSIKLAVDAGIATPFFIGEKKQILDEAKKLDWDISAYEVRDADGEEQAARLSALAARAGEVDVIMKGQLHTDVFMKAMLSKEEGIRAGKRFVHVFHMSLPEVTRPLLISDGAVNVAPDLKTSQTALIALRDISHKLGMAEPKIAILSATEEPIPSVPSSLVARDLTVWAQDQLLGAMVSGPLALDLVLSPQSAEIKGRAQDPVAGQADAVLVPEIVSGNVLFKSLVYLRGACAAGIVTGGHVPLVLTSRADPPAARLASIALAAVAAN